MRAVENVIRDGRGNLEMALASNPLNKMTPNTAKNLIDIGIEKSETIKTNIKEL